MPGLGRIPSIPDKRDYRMADYMSKLTPHQWVDQRVLDQGSTPHCVGFSWAGWGISTPVVDTYANKDGNRIYYEAKVIDGEAGQENGSSVRSGAKAMQSDGRLKVYYFASSIQEAAQYVSQYGPVVLGIDWYNNMFVPVRGIIKPGGGIAGGHAILWYGVDSKYARLRNSWGSTWGVKGDCRISLADLASIFAGNGEACAATELPLGPKKACILKRIFSR